MEITHNYKIRKEGPRKKYVCKEGGGCQKFSCIPPPPCTFFFGIALSESSHFVFI